MKILLLGANGQVGFELHRSLAPLGTVIPCTRSGTLPGSRSARRADLEDIDALLALLDEIRPDVVVNAAAYTAVDRAESEPEDAMQVNATAPGALGRWCMIHGSRLIHYSTDYVFDGQAERPWRETDGVAPLGVYGESKLAGERAIRESGAEHLILRTAWVYAARGHNFLRTMLRLGAEREQLNIVADQVGSPTPAHWIAAATALALARWPENGDSPGLLHLSAAGSASWHGFATAIFAASRAAGLIEREPEVIAIPSSDYPTPAARPAFSCLDNRLVRERLGIRLPEWEVGLEQVIGELVQARGGF